MKNLIKLAMMVLLSNTSAMIPSVDDGEKNSKKRSIDDQQSSDIECIHFPKIMRSIHDTKEKNMQALSKLDALAWRNILQYLDIKSIGHLESTSQCMKDFILNDGFLKNEVFPSYFELTEEEKEKKEISLNLNNKTDLFIKLGVLDDFDEEKIDLYKLSLLLKYLKKYPEYFLSLSAQAFKMADSSAIQFIKALNNHSQIKNLDIAWNYFSKEVYNTFSNIHIPNLEYFIIDAIDQYRHKKERLDFTKEFLIKNPNIKNLKLVDFIIDDESQKNMFTSFQEIDFLNLEEIYIGVLCLNSCGKEFLNFISKNKEKLERLNIDSCSADDSENLDIFSKMILPKIKILKIKDIDFSDANTGIFYEAINQFIKNNPNVEKIYIGNEIYYQKDTSSHNQ